MKSLDDLRAELAVHEAAYDAEGYRDHWPTVVANRAKIEPRIEELRRLIAEKAPL